MPNPLPLWQETLLQHHQLPRTYLAYAQEWFAPLGEKLAMHQSGAVRPLVVAVNGCQGSGKSTVCDYLRSLLVTEYGLNVVCLSLDDFYLTRTEREALAQSVHPLLATRGVPGTHDMHLLNRVLQAILHPVGSEPVAIPRFDKASDDRHPRFAWDCVMEPVDLVLLEGWCLGARPQSAAELAAPVNGLERDEDPDGSWRSYVNAALARDFLPLYRGVDHWVMLQAPSFDCVYRWRLEQEQKLAAKAGPGGANAVMDEVRVARFVQYFERLTRHCLEQLPARVEDLYRLDEQRQVMVHEQHAGASL